ncbi:MAG: M20 family metallopeptidase [Anaerolineae bacterium]|jgi:acetylornithine deacetylase/succinyl-diaminopimelate desuccinylase family protein|nr:M20 family metallopeptidase [Anaerolineae bacterium]
MSDVVTLLQDLIRIPSPNPPGDTRAIAAFIADTLRRAGCVVSTPAPEAKPQAVNVLASIGQGTPVIMLHAHIDTVPIAEDEAQHWHVDPYAAVIEEGRVYGKGSVDDKAPLAAMMHTLLAAAAQPHTLRGTLLLVAAAEEETGGQLGTRWLAEAGHLPPCDFIVVGEQTHNHVATAHKGVMRAQVTTTGRSVHATSPDRGINAITAMAKVVLALEAYHRDLSRRVHPLVGVPTCNVGVIAGGSTANAVPDRCTVWLDRRMIPGEDPAVVQQELAAVVQAVDVAPAQVSVGGFQTSMWFDSGVNSALAQQFLACVGEELNAPPGPIGYLPGSDAKHLLTVMRGDMVIFGPGSYEVAHAFDEYVAIDELAATARILQTFIQRTLQNG